MNSTEIRYEINQILVKIRWISANDLWDRYDIRYYEDRLAFLKGELEKMTF